MESLYSVMQGLESRLGGGEGVEGIYGSITATGMHKVLECMKHNCGLGRNSTLIDIGAGLGRPLLHALMLHGVAHGYGVELDRVKVAKAEAFCKGVIDELAVRGVLHSSGKDATAAAAAADDAVSTKPAAAAAAGESEGLIDASQDSGLGTQEAKSPAAAAAADGADPSDVSDDTKVQFDSSQTGPAAAAAAGGRSDATPSAASGKGKQTSAAAAAAAAAAPDTVKKGAGAKTPKVKGQVLLWPASRPIITCAAIEQIASLDPGTHAYSFWEGVPLRGKKAFGRLFRISKTMKAVAVVQRAMRGQTPESVMVDLGFGPLMLIKAFPVSMSGSGRSFQAYVFSKVAPPAALLMMRQGAAATEQQQQQRQDSGSLDVLASSTKPPRGSRLKGVADSEADDTAAADDDVVGDYEGSPDQQHQHQLIPLLTEQSIAAMQQQQQQGDGHSPGKRGQPFQPAAAAEGDLNGSPSKKQRGAGGTAAAANGLARGGSGLYGLRPRQLSSSFSSGSSSTATSAATTAATTAATAAAVPRAASGRRSGLRSNSGSISRGGSTAASMSVDQPFVGGSGGSSRGSSRGTRSTAVSGGGSSRAKKQQHQQQQQEVLKEEKAAAAAAGGGGKGTGSRRGQRGGCSTLSAAVSEARGAVAALDV